MALQCRTVVAELRLHGSPWRPDPDDYRYADGWWYAAQTRTLSIECTQQREVEEPAVSFP